MYKIAICDDDKKTLEYVESCLKDIYGDTIKCYVYSEAEDLIDSWEKGKNSKEDIVIMDIQFSQIDGISAAGHIQREYGKAVKVIFMTGYIDYAKNIFDIEPTYFLTKPIEKPKLIQAVDKAINKIEEEKKDILVCEINGGVVCKNLRNIVFIESNRHSLIIHDKNNDTKIFMKLDEMEDQLPFYFLRCHQSFSVNMNYIEAFLGKEIDLGKYGKIPVSRSNYKKSKEIFLEYLGESL